jgi:hypothetical protein
MNLKFIGSEFRKKNCGAKVILNGRYQIKLVGIRGNKEMKLYFGKYICQCPQITSHLPYVYYIVEYQWI